jgi:fatty-acyl-CoA synthase
MSSTPSTAAESWWADTPGDWNYAAVLREVSSVVPDRIAIVCSGRHVSFGEFDAETDALALALSARGLSPGAKVAIDLLNAPQYLSVFYAALKIGAVPVNVNYRYQDVELEYLLDYVDAEVIFVHDVFLSAVEKATARLERDLLTVAVPFAQHPTDCAHVLYDDLLAEGYRSTLALDHVPNGDDLIFICTGGTTGMPKAVMWRNDDLYVSQWMLSRPGKPPASPGAAMREGKRAGTTLPGPPLMHGTGLYAALGTLSGGGSVVLVDSLGLDCERIWREVASERVKALTIVGDVFARPLLSTLDRFGGSLDVSSLEVISSSGTIFSGELKSAFIERIPKLRIVDSLGATEGMVSRSVTSSASDAAPRFTVSDRVAVFTADGLPVEPGRGTPGLLGVTGRLPLGYYKDPIKTAATFPTINGRRYSVAGDMATVQSDGTIIFLGRGSATINTGGEKVFPEEVEAELRAITDIVDCCVVGVPDERWGQRVTAVVELRDGSALDSADILERLRPRLAGYKVPKRVAVVPSLERGPNGKVDYRRVAELATLAPGEETSRE